MSTSYTIAHALTPGYVYSDRQSCDAKDLHQLATEIKLSDLESKAKEYGILNYINSRELGEILTLYADLPTKDLTCKFDASGVYQCASGGGKWRQAKEIARQAFCILLIDAAFKRGWTVSLGIT